MSKKKNLPDNILKLKNQLESGNNLIDYFLVCGCDPSVFYTEKDLFNLSNDKKSNLNNLSQIIKLQMITKFPEFDNNNDTIDDEILSYCFPYGFKPYYNDTGKMIEKKFSIILDNNLFSSDYPQKYLTCLVFYESLAQYKELADEFFGENNSDLNEEELAAFNNNGGNIIQNHKKENFNKLREDELMRKKTYSNENQQIKYGRSYTKTEEPEVKSLNKLQKYHKYRYYFIPKCICIVSIHPNIKLFQEILSSIYKYSLSYQNIPIEKIITNILIEVPIAPRGLYSIDFTLLDSIKTLTQTENNKLLLTEIDLKNFYNNINLDIQLDVIKHLIFGSKVIFFSKNINNLTESILAFLFLLFPFKYPFQVTSCLNNKSYNILESISPYFIGINESYNSEFFLNNDISIEGLDLLVVDLDNNISDLKTSENFPEFPSKLINNFKKDIKIIKKKYLKGEDEHEDAENNENKEEEIEEINEKESEQIIEEFNGCYQETFFFFICELIKNYEEYLNMNYFKHTKDIVTSIETLFNCDEYIKFHSSSENAFYNKFVKDSQLFSDFIYKRMIPKNNQEIIDVLLVNDTLTKIKNKNKFFGKEPTDFLDSRDYMKKNRYIVPKPRELTENEKQFINNHIEQLIEKGQIISNNYSEKKDNIIFKYVLFPKLDFDIYCNNENANEYCPPPDYSEDIESINNDVISKSSLGQTMNRSLEMINYLYLSWLEVWAFTFWYIDAKEKPYRFNQMIDVLNKVIHHEMNILNLLFDALNRSSQNEMILKLYRKLIDLNINPSSFIYNIISSIIDKTQMRVLKEELKISQVKLDDNVLKYKNCNRNKNIKRTFSSVEDYLEINQELKFYSNFSCIQCGEKINLLNICKNFSEVKNDILWVPCKCGEYNLPKIKVRFGKELLRDKTYKTSTLDEIVIHSPYNFKENIKSAVMRQYGKDLMVTDFKSQFKPLFWNFIWYCKIHKLDYEIILPYLKDINNLRKIKHRNKAKEIFEITYEDKYFKENLNKINKYSKIIYERFVDKSKEKKVIHKDDLKVENEINLEFIIEKKKYKNENVKIDEIKENIDLNKKLNKLKPNNIITQKIEEKNKTENFAYIKEENEINIIKEEEEEEKDDKSEENIKGGINKEIIIDEQENMESSDYIIYENNKEDIKEEEKEIIEKDDIQKENDEEIKEEKKEDDIEEEIEKSVEDEQIQREEPKEELQDEQKEEPNEFNNLGNEYLEENEEEEEEKEYKDEINDKINVEEIKMNKNQFKNKIEKDIISKSINVELKKIPDLAKVHMNPNQDDLNINLKKIDESALKKEVKPEKKIKYKLKKVENLNKSVNINVNPGEDFLAQMKKRLKKVGTKGVKI